MGQARKNWIAVACAEHARLGRDAHGVTDHDMQLIAHAMAAEPTMLYFP